MDDSLARGIAVVSTVVFGGAPKALAPPRDALCGHRRVVSGGDWRARRQPGRPRRSRSQNPRRNLLCGRPEYAAPTGLVFHWRWLIYKDSAPERACCDSNEAHPLSIASQTTRLLSSPDRPACRQSKRGKSVATVSALATLPLKMSSETDIPEEELVWSFFDNKTTGFFVDVGANHPFNWSQTWLLEKNGWRGILVEPQEAYYELLRQERKNSVVWRAACSSPRKQGEALLYRPNDNPGVATLQKNADDPDIRYDRSEKVQVVTLDEILIKAGRPSIDLLSLDVEGTELEVLEGFDIAQYRPKLILMEDKCQSPRKHFYLRRAGYRFMRRTGFNNWYVPKEDPRCRIRLDQRLEFFRKMYLALPFRRFQRFRAWLRSRLQTRVFPSRRQPVVGQSRKH